MFSPRGLSGPDEIKWLCETAAREHAADSKLLIAFDVIQFEVEPIKAYMAEHYPGVPFVFGNGKHELNVMWQGWLERNK